MQFPLRTVRKEFSPNQRDADLTHLHVSQLSELTVKSISFSESDIAKHRKSPSLLQAHDVRAPNLPHMGLGYQVTNDVWQPLSDPEIQAGFRRLKAEGAGL